MLGIRLFVAVALFCLLVLGALPSFLSTRIGKEFLLETIKHEYQENIDVGNLSLSWFGTQELERFFWKDSSVGVSLSFDKLIIEQGLFSFLLSPRDATLIVERPKALLQTPSKTKSSTTHNTDSTSNKRKFSCFLPQLELLQGSITLLQEDGGTIRVDPINVSIRTSKKEKITTLKLDAQTKIEEKMGSLSLAIIAADPNAHLPHYNPMLKALFPQVSISATANIDQFPTLILDALAEKMHIPPYFQDALGPEIIGSLKEEKKTFAIEIISENLQVKGEMDQNFEVIEPFEIQWNIPTSFANQTFFSSFGLTLEPPVQFHLLMDAFVLTQGDNLETSFEMNFSPFVFHVKEDQAVLKGDKLQAISRIYPKEAKRDFAIEATCQWKGKPFQLSLQGITPLGDWSPFCLEECFSGLWNFQGTALPTELLDQVTPPNISYENLLGKHLNISFKTTTNTPTRLATLSIFSEQLIAENIELSIGKIVNLTKPNQILYTLPAKENYDKDQTFPFLLSNEPIKIDIERFSCDLTPLKKGDLITFNEKLAYVGQIDAPELFLQKKEEIPPFSFENFTFLASKKIDLPTNIVVKTTLLPNQNSFFIQPIQGRLDASIHIQSSMDWYIDPLKLSLDSPEIQANGSFKLQENGYFSFNTPLNLVYTLTPNSLAQLTQQTKDQVQLQEPAVFIFTVDKTLNTFNIHNIDSFHVTGSLQCEHITLFDTNHTYSTLKNINADFAIDPIKHFFDFQLSIETLHDNVEGSVESTFFASNWWKNGQWSPEEACIGGSCELCQFPSLFITLFPSVQNLAPWITPTFDLYLEGTGQCGQVPDGTLIMALTSDVLEIETAFKFDQDEMFLTPLRGQLSQIRAQINQEMLDSFLQLFPAPQRDVRLKQEVQVTCAFNQLQLPNPWYRGWFSLLGEATGKGHLIIDSITLNENHEEIEIPQLTGEFAMPSSSQPIRVKIGTSQDRPYLPNINILLEMERPNKHNPVTTVQIDASAIPLAKVTRFLETGRGLSDKIEALLGNDVSFSCKLYQKGNKGPCSLNLVGKNISLQLQGRLDHYLLTLSEPLQADIELTEEVSKTLVGEVIPLFTTAKQPNHPVHLTVHPQGFSFPLIPFSMESLFIQEAVLELGKIELRPTGELKEIFSILKLEDKPVETVWFTPIYFTVANGIVYLDRFDFLIGTKYHMALWGDVSFPKDKIQLKLGLGASTLENAFDVEGLPANFILPLNLKGSLNHAKIDKKKAVAKIGALVAQGKGSPQGLFIGNLLELLSGSFKEEPAPPPTTTPFPWESDGEVKTHSKESDLKSLLKVIEKGAGSFLKKIR